MLSLSPTSLAAIALVLGGWLALAVWATVRALGRERSAAERIDCDYLGRIVKMTLLGPDIVEAVLDGRQPLELGLPTLTLSIATASQSLPGR